MAEVPSFKAVMERSAPTESEIRQFMADQEAERNREWVAKHRPELNPMTLFGNCK